MWKRKRALKGLDADIRDHIDRQTEENVARGMARDEARRQALLKFGSVALAKEDTRAVWIPRVLDSLRADLRYASRGLLKHPAYTVTAILTLTVAIGLTSSVVTVFNGLFLRPWPVPDPDRVFALTLVAPRGVPDQGMPGVSPSFAEFEALSASATRADLVAAQGVRLRVQTGAGATLERVSGLAVSARYFDVLRVPLQQGRGFLAPPAENTATAVISDGFWRRALGGDPAVIGQTIVVNDRTTTIVGVVPRSFLGTQAMATDVYLPFPSAGDWDGTWRAWGLGVATAPPQVLQVDIAGRMRGAWTRVEARTELDALHRQVAPSVSSDTTPAFLRSLSAREVWLTHTALGQRPGELRSNVGTVFAYSFAACGLVLLLASANVSNLQLARNLARVREIATRLALGASRGRVLRQLMTEALLLACVAGAGGLALAWWLPSVVFALAGASTTTPAWDITPNAPVLAFAVLLCTLMTIGFALVPALQVTRRDGHSAAIVNSRATLHATRRIRGTVLGLQVAISTVLLVAAVLLTRGVTAVSSALGFAVEDVTVGRVALPTGTTGAAARVALEPVRAALDRAGFAQVAYSQYVLPLEGPGRQVDLDVTPGGQLQGRSVVVQVVSSNYFATLDLPFVSGRTFSEAVGSAEAVINESTLRLLPTGSALGTEILVNKTSFRVVGVVRDAYLVNLTRLYPMVFRSSDGEPLAGVLVRDARPDAGTRAESIVRATDSRASVTMVPISRTIAERTSQTRVAASLAAGIAGLALTLAVVGVFGMFGYMVEERRREIGIRLALGARRSQVVLTALRATRAATIGGLAVGLALAVVVGRLLRGYLYGLSSLDPVSYVAVLALLAIAAVLATILPARRAARVNPVEALRAE